MPLNRLPWVTKYYSPTGRRNHGTPSMRLLDTWDRNGSTSGPNAWQIYDDYVCMYVFIYVCMYTHGGDRGSAVVKVLCYKSKGRWFDPSWCQWIFHWHKILPIALWHWGRLSLFQKWLPVVFPGGNGGRCVRLTTYLHPVPLSRNLGT